MYIVPIAWLYVAVLMSVAEATNTNGTVLGALITFVMYGLAPVALVLYLMGSPARRRAIKAREAAETTESVALSQVSQTEPDAGGHAAGATQGDAVAAVRKEP